MLTVPYPEFCSNYGDVTETSFYPVLAFDVPPHLRRLRGRIFE